MSELDKNQHVADVICSDREWEGKKFRLGECVVLLDGEVLSVETDLEQALETLRKIEPDPGRGMLVEVGKPIVEVIR